MLKIYAISRLGNFLKTCICSSRITKSYNALILNVQHLLTHEFFLVFSETVKKYNIVNFLTILIETVEKQEPFWLIEDDLNC